MSNTLCKDIPIDDLDDQILGRMIKEAVMYPT